MSRVYEAIGELRAASAAPPVRAVHRDTIRSPAAGPRRSPEARFRGDSAAGPRLYRRAASSSSTAQRSSCARSRRWTSNGPKSLPTQLPLSLVQAFGNFIAGIVAADRAAILQAPPCRCWSTARSATTCRPATTSCWSACCGGGRGSRDRRVPDDLPAEITQERARITGSRSPGPRRRPVPGPSAVRPGRGHPLAGELRQRRQQGRLERRTQSTSWSAATSSTAGSPLKG